MGLLVVGLEGTFASTPRPAELTLKTGRRELRIKSAENPELSHVKYGLVTQRMLSAVWSMCVQLAAQPA